ncbi:hypothetical protein GNF80_06255 [Clostridium perfringens]|nr:hypothetical protein [Clostridium perfringens]
MNTLSGVIFVFIASCAIAGLLRRIGLGGNNSGETSDNRRDSYFINSSSDYNWNDCDCDSHWGSCDCNDSWGECGCDSGGDCGGGDCGCD